MQRGKYVDITTKTAYNAVNQTREKRTKVKNYKFAWFNIGCMVVLAAVLFINRGYKFFETRSWPGYVIYALFILFALLAITSIVMTIAHYRRAGNK